MQIETRNLGDDDNAILVQQARRALGAALNRSGGLGRRWGTGLGRKRRPGPKRISLREERS